MEYLSNLSPISREATLLVLSIVDVELAVFAFWRIRRLLSDVRMAWLVGRMAAQLRREAQKQTKRAEIDQLTQRLAARATISFEGESELDAATLLDTLERILAD